MIRLPILLLSALLCWASNAGSSPLAELTPRGQVQASVRPKRANRSLTGKQRKEVYDYLRSKTRIGIHVVSAPGHGHQAANVSLMQRLRELGFRGQFAITTEGNDTAAKLRSIMPGHLLRDSSINENDTLPDLVISGANDWSPAVPSATFLQLQPEDWGRGRGGPSLTRSSGPSLTLNIPKGYRFKIKRRTGTDLRKFLEREMTSDPMRPKLNALRSIIAGHFELLPVYGVGIKGGVPKIGRLVDGIIELGSEDSEFKQKPTIIPILSNLNEEEQKQLVKLVRAKATVSSVADAAEHIATAWPGQIILVTVGTVPKQVFEQLFAWATLPPMVAGKNGSNLAQMLGIPYLNTVGDIPAALRHESTVADAHDALRVDAPRKLVRFLRESRDATSSLRHGYSSLSQWQEPGTDQVLKGIFAIVEAEQGVSSMREMPSNPAAPQKNMVTPTSSNMAFKLGSKTAFRGVKRKPSMPINKQMRPTMPASSSISMRRLSQLKLGAFKPLPDSLSNDVPKLKWTRISPLSQPTTSQ